jgi:hypothetical protein
MDRNEEFFQALGVERVAYYCPGPGCPDKQIQVCEHLSGNMWRATCSGCGTVWVSALTISAMLGKAENGQV